MSSFRVALADDHAILRDVLKRILSSGSDIEVIADVGDGIALLNMLVHLPTLPDMVILDVAMPKLGGPEVAHCIRMLYPGIKILMFTMHDEEEYVSRSFKAGADGYLLKEDDTAELFAAIYAIRGGQTYRSPLLEFRN